MTKLNIRRRFSADSNGMVRRVRPEELRSLLHNFDQQTYPQIEMITECRVEINHQRRTLVVVKEGEVIIRVPDLPISFLRKRRARQ